MLLFSIAILVALSASAVAAQHESWVVKAKEAFRRGELIEVSRLARRALDQKMDPGQAHEWLGRVAAARNEHTAADLHFKKAHGEGARLSRFAEAWSQGLRKLGRGEDACRVLTEASEDDSSEPHSAYSAGACHLSRDDPHQAVHLLRRAYDEGIRHTGCVLALARASLQVGREDDALDLLGPLSKRTTSDSLLLKIGELLFQRLLYRQAIEVLSRGWQFKKGDRRTGMYLALSHYMLGEYEESLRVLTAIHMPYLSEEYRYLLGSVYARLGQSDQAERELELGVAAHPERAGGYLNLGLFHLERGNRSRAMELLEKGSARLRPGTKLFYVIRSRINCAGLEAPIADSEPDVERGRFYTNLASVLLERQQWGSALEVYLLALQMNPFAPEAYGGVGLICQELGTPGVGLEFLKAGLRLHPRDSDLHYYAGSLYEVLGHPRKALKSYEEATLLGDRESPARYWVRLGMAYRSVGEPAKAESSFQKALARDPDSAEARYHLGKLYMSTRRFELAEEALEQAVRLAPSMQEAYYAYGLACIRNGKIDWGRAILKSHRRKEAIRDSQFRSAGISAQGR